MITGIGHVAINAKDMEKSLDFYERVLGLPEAFRLEGADGSLSMVYVKTGPRNFLEIFPRAAAGPERRNDQQGIKHYCLWVDDLAATLAELEARGLPVDRSRVRVGRTGSRIYFVADPDGVQVELMELLPDSMQARAMGAAAAGPS
mgnify:CR=1 FL=1